MKTILPQNYADRIKALRRKFSLTQMRLAELMGVSFASVNRWENGQAKPSGLAWQQIARAEMLGLQALDRDFVAEDSGQGRETSSDIAARGEDAVLDFLTPAEIVRLVSEAERLAYAHQFNPAFAAETSRIDPLPHQRIAVYEHMLKQPRLRFLLADDAGAGKTIMAGLYIREMLARRLIQRVLIVPPAGLVSNWEREMRGLFNLPFRAVSGTEARSGNPFAEPDGNSLIISVDTLAGPKMMARLREPQVQPYDLVIFDEAHKLAADREPDFRIRKTERYKLAEGLAGISDEPERWGLPWSTRHLLLLTATPHMGRDYPYYCLWRLLEPEILPTYDAFSSFPPQMRKQHFIRRTKEEMVRFDGSLIYPRRISDTLSYELSQGAISEQRLYDETTTYIETQYNRARILNRSAARLAMSIFQRRLASSTYALLRSFERRLEKLDALVDAIRAGTLSPESLLAEQKELDALSDPLDNKTADEEFSQDGEEENELVEREILSGMVAITLVELQAEQAQVRKLLDLAGQVEGLGQESKFSRLRQIINDPGFRDDKVIIFTEHKDTLDFIVRRLNGIGFGGQVAQIHGGMGTKPDPASGRSARDEQVEFFRKPAAQGGARFLVATDAAGEGINLQFCWLMVNYDIPWNPARLEQRMGRIHRYKQTRDVVILNLVAGETREGRVMKTLLDKLERIRKELRSDKVFDVVGRLFSEISIKEYMSRLLEQNNERDLLAELDGKLTKEQVRALEEREQSLYGLGGEVKSQLPQLQKNMDQEVYRRLMPGYVRRFVENAAPHLNLAIDGRLNEVFSLQANAQGALDPLWPVMELYPQSQRAGLTFDKAHSEQAIFLHPGEPLFDRLHALVGEKFSEAARRGGVFIDPSAGNPYFFHLARIEIVRRADDGLPALCNPATLETRLVGLRQEADGSLREVPVESLLLLRGGDGQANRALGLLAHALGLQASAAANLHSGIAQQRADAQRLSLQTSLPERLDFLKRGYTSQENELLSMRARYREKADLGDPRAKAELTKIKQHQRALQEQREQALAALQREPELIAPGEITFLAHALVLPSADQQDIQQRDQAIEAAAMQVAIAYEEAAGATVLDVSLPEKARQAGLGDWPGFDLLSRYPSGEEKAIEVKGRAHGGDVFLSENEWGRAENLKKRYWLYVVYQCASPAPSLTRIQDPFYTLIARANGFVIKESEILQHKGHGQDG